MREGVEACHENDEKQKSRSVISDCVGEVHDTHHPVGPSLYYEDQKREAKRYAQVAKGGPRDQLLNHLDAEALLPVVNGHEPLAVFASRESDIREAVKVTTF